MSFAAIRISINLCIFKQCASSCKPISTFMKKTFLLLTAICSLFTALAQEDDNNRADSIGARIVDEGKQLYRSEMASWYGTDVFLEQFKERDKIGGYFSYTD